MATRPATAPQQMPMTVGLRRWSPFDKHPGERPAVAICGNRHRHARLHSRGHSRAGVEAEPQHSSRSHGEVDSDRRSGRVRLRPPTLETTMQSEADRPEAPNTIHNNLGAIFRLIGTARLIPMRASLPACRRTKVLICSGFVGHWPRHRLLPVSLTTQIDVIFCETSKPTKRVINEPSMANPRATPPGSRYYRRIKRRPRLSDVQWEAVTRRARAGVSSIAACEFLVRHLRIIERNGLQSGFRCFAGR